MGGKEGTVTDVLFANAKEERDGAGGGGGGVEKKRKKGVARKRSRSFCQKCRRQVTAKHACTLRTRMWLCMM